MVATIKVPTLVSLCVGGRLVCRSVPLWPAYQTATYAEWYITDDVLIQLILLMMSSSLTCIPDGHLHRLIYTRWCIDTTDSPDDEHCVARNT